MLPKKKTNKNNKNKTRIEKQINKLQFCNIAQYAETLIVHIRDNCKMNVDILKVFQVY